MPCPSGVDQALAGQPGPGWGSGRPACAAGVWRAHRQPHG